MDVTRGYHTKWSKWERQMSGDIPYVESKIWHAWTYQWKRIRLRQTEQTCGYQGGGGVQGGIDWEFGVSRCKVLYIYIYIKWIDNRVLLLSTGN